MKKMSVFLLVLLTTCFSVLDIQAQENSSDAVYLSITKEFTLNPDSSTDFRYVKEQKLFTYRAFHSLYGETFVVYDPGFQKLKINDVHTIMADGKKIEAPKNAFNEVLPSNATNAPAYNSFREMVITHTGLERNATIHLDYQVHTAKGLIPGLMGNELLAENEPVKSLTIKIRVPANTDLFYNLFNSKNKPEESTEGMYRVYSWTFKDVPAISAEESQPGGNEKYPRLLFSTLKSRDEAYNFLTGQAAFRASISEEMRTVLNELINNNRDRFELALKIQDLVVDNMKLYPVPAKSTQYLCRTPEQTWNSNGGTALEKAVLMALLMKEAGINASVCAIARTVNADENIGSLADIEDFAIVADFKDEGTWYFSVTSLNPVNLKQTLPGRSFIKIIPGQKFEVTAAENPKQKVIVKGTFIVSSDPKLTGEVSFYFEGAVYPYAGLKRDKKKMKAMTGGISSADLKDEKSSIINNNNGFQSFIVQSDNPFKKDSNYMTLVIPSVGQGIDSWGMRALPGKRLTPVELPSLADESYAFSFTLPSGLTLFTPAKKVTINNKAGSFTWELVLDKGKLILNREIKFKERIISPENYKDFKALMDSWNHPRYREVIFTQ